MYHHRRLPVPLVTSQDFDMSAEIQADWSTVQVSVPPDMWSLADIGRGHRNLTSWTINEALLLTRIWQPDQACLGPRRELRLRRLPLQKALKSRAVAQCG
jgi:hypothetical protein